MTTLFHAWTIVDQYMDEKNVMFRWFVRGRDEQIVNYQDVLNDYEKYSPEQQNLTQMALDELFTKEEVESLHSYVNKSHESTVLAQEVLFPLTEPLSPVSKTVIGPNDYYYTLTQEPEYNLDLDVWARFDLRDCTINLNSEE